MNPRAKKAKQGMSADEIISKRNMKLSATKGSTDVVTEQQAAMAAAALSVEIQKSGRNRSLGLGTGVARAKVV